MHFPNAFVKWVELCISTSSFSINLNGNLTGNFKDSRGLKQGDPLSPCLFILVIEELTQLLKKRALNNQFSFHPRCDRLNITSVAFADGLFIFSKAYPHSATITKTTLDIFQTASSLKPTLQKSMAFTSVLSPQMQIGISQVLGMQIRTLPIRFLGFSLTIGKLTYAS